jgi:hypothetical protein
VNLARPSDRRPHPPVVRLASGGDRLTFARNCALPARPSVCAVKASHLAPLVAKGFFEQCQKQRSMNPPRMKSCQRRCANNCAGIKDVEAVKRRC